MFDLIAGKEKHLPSHATVPILVSSFAQATVIGLVVLLPILLVTDRLPEVPTMMAFVAVPPTPPPPPPPAHVAAKPKQAAKTVAKPSEAEFIAPREEPAKMPELPNDEGLAGGVAGGVEGGIPDGVVGGVVGGLPEAPPPPPPPSPPAPRAPVRIGGKITPPQLIKRVEPVYPALAANARIQGIVILEATVGENGEVREVRLLRSVNPLVDREAERALWQWRYSPVVLNGIPVPFVLTVTFSFRVEAPQ